MPEKDGLSVLNEMKRDASRAKVVVLTAIETGELLDAIQLGARGVVLKDMAVRLLLQCVRVVHSGGTWIERSVAGRVVDGLLQTREATTGGMVKCLTAREAEVARMI